jgi:hypothetical protein
MIQIPPQDEILKELGKEVSLVVNEIIVVEGAKVGVTEKQMLPEIRCSNRIQEHLMKKDDFLKENEGEKQSGQLLGLIMMSH